jgi:F-type H+-transporting ATPase subunit epsilon
MAVNNFKLKIVTPDGLMFDETVESLLIHTDDGDVEFLAGHIDYMASLSVGRARIKQNGKSRLASVSGGFVTVMGGEVNLIAITFEFSENIDIERAKASAERASSIISSSKDIKAIELAKARLARAFNRISVANM